MMYGKVLETATLRNPMKRVMMIAVILSANAAFAAEGTVETKMNPARSDAMGVFIYGKAASAISRQLSSAQVKYVRDRFSGQLVQTGEGIRCIQADGTTSPYCYLQIEDGAVN